MDKQKEPGPPLRTGHYYRCHPTLSEAQVVASYLVDLDGTHLQFFHLADLTFHSTVEILSKEDQYCATMAVISPRILVVFGLNKFVIFDIESMAIVESVKINFYIEKMESVNGFIALLTSDEDSENKVVHCWKLDTTSGHVQEKYTPTPFIPQEFEECTEDNLKLALIVSIEKALRVYIFWEGTNSMIELDPIQQQSQQYSRQSVITFVTDLTEETYAEILDNKINVFHKKAGKRIAQLFSEKEVFTHIFGDGSRDTLYSISNLGIKRWKLETNAEPVLFVASDKHQIKQLFLAEGKVVGINKESNSVVIWDSPEVSHSHSFPNQVIRRVIKVDEKLAFFLLEATASSQEENDFLVSKYNKLEVYDFEKDIEVAKKAMLQAKYSVDGDSIVIRREEQVTVIRFIVKEETEAENKKYILKWTPFNKDENQKDTKKKEIKGISKYESVRMNPYGRIIGLSKPKQSESFSLFAKEADEKVSLALFDYNAKKVGEYDFAGDVQAVELSEKNQIYTVGTERVCIYAVDASNKNQLEKINELDIKALFVRPFKDFLLIRKPDSYLLLDAEFECVMREVTPEDDMDCKLIPYQPTSFLLKTEKTLAVWDFEREDIREVTAPECSPNMVEVMDGKLIVADNWVQAYDLNVQ